MIRGNSNLQRAMSISLELHYISANTTIITLLKLQFGLKFLRLPNSVCTEHSGTSEGYGDYHQPMLCKLHCVVVKAVFKGSIYMINGN